MLPEERFQFEGNQGGVIIEERQIKGRSIFVSIFLKIGLAKTEDQAKQFLVIFVLISLAIMIVITALNIQPKDPKFVTKSGKVLNLEQVIKLKKAAGKEI